MKNTFIAIDTETTGLSFETDRIIQLGICVFINGKAVHRVGFYVANTDVPNSGFGINGITDEQIASGRDPFWSFCFISSIMHKQPRVILAYNAPFDLMMLANEFMRHGIEYDFSRLNIVDPLVIHRKFKPFLRGKLIDVCSMHRIPYEGSHDAADDAEAAGHVFLSQRIHHGIRGTWRDLHNRQLVWHREWADGFKSRYLARGKEVNITPWPYDKELECFLTNDQSLLW